MARTDCWPSRACDAHRMMLGRGPETQAGAPASEWGWRGHREACDQGENSLNSAPGEAA